MLFITVKQHKYGDFVVNKRYRAIEIWKYLINNVFTCAALHRTVPFSNVSVFVYCFKHIPNGNEWKAIYTKTIKKPKTYR